jgi:nicotinate-nucleotide adenylyltransferase
MPALTGGATILPAIRPAGPLMGLPDPAGRRIGLFGGSFNPPHPGHLALAAEALTRLELAQVWWMVSPQNPLKKPQETQDFAARFRATCELAGSMGRRIEVLDIESKLRTRWTAQTLNVLQPVIDRGRFVWIMGADSFADLHRWNAWRTIPDSLPLAVFARPGWCLRALSSPAARVLAPYRIRADQARLLPDLAPPAWCFLTMPLRQESSTAIRRTRGAIEPVAPLSPAPA